ncbi:MAG: SAM-dependent DNA methyltransferase, partial [Bacteroidetes bacterium]
NNANIFLFNAGKKPTNPAVLKYIKLGEEQGIDKKYLTSKRSPWYSPENRPPAPIWVSVFNRGRMKFIRNEAGLFNLTTFHCIYIKQDLFAGMDVELLFAYLQTSIAAAIFNDNRREYGGGLKKFEPNDLNQGLILNLALLTRAERKAVKQLYFKYRESVILADEDSTCLNQIEDIFNEIYKSNKTFPLKRKS